MTVNRLEEFHSSSGHPPKLKQPISPPSFDKTFFATVAEINRLLKHAESCTKRSEVLHKQAVVAVNKVEAINADIEFEKKEFKQCVAEMKGMIEALNHPNERLIKSQKLALNSKLLKVIEAFEQMQRTSRTRYRACLERQYLILKPTADASELAIISQVSLQVSPQSMFSVSNAESKLAEMKARQDDLKKLEKDLLELHELALKIQLIVMEQGEKVQSLDEYVSGIEEQTSKAAEVMVKAVVGKRASQKRKWIVILVVLVVLVVTGLIIYISWKADQKTIIVQVPPPPPLPPQPGLKKSTGGWLIPKELEDQMQGAGEKEKDVPQASAWPISNPVKPENVDEASTETMDEDESSANREDLE